MPVKQRSPKIKRPSPSPEAIEIFREMQQLGCDGDCRPYARCASCTRFWILDGRLHAALDLLPWQGYPTVTDPRSLDVYPVEHSERRRHEEAVTRWRWLKAALRNQA